MSLVVRTATTADAAAISALTTALTERWIAPDCSDAGTRHLRAWMSPDAHTERLRANHVCCIAEHAGELVGVAAIRPPRHLYLLFVANAFQRQGLARRLWEQVRTRACAREGIGAITVNASRPALEVYRRLGFVALEAERIEHGVPSTPMRWDPQ